VLIWPLKILTHHPVILDFHDASPKSQYCQIVFILDQFNLPNLQLRVDKKSLFVGSAYEDSGLHDIVGVSGEAKMEGS
jgi:hypothetical protein